MAATTSQTVPPPTFGDLQARQRRADADPLGRPPPAGPRCAPSSCATWSCCGSTRSSSPCARWCSRSCCASSSSTCSRRSVRASAAPAASPERSPPSPRSSCPGVVGLSIMFQGIQAVAMPLAQEFGFTREIEDRVQAPCPIWLVAISKVISGGAQGLISAAIVLPIASVVHAAGVEAQHQSPLAAHRDAGPAVVRLHGIPRPAPRDIVRAAQPRPDVRLHRAARSPSWVAPTTSGRGWRPCKPDPSTGCRSSC